MTGRIESTWSGAGPELVMLGDSITVQSHAALHRVLDRNYRTKIGALVGEGFGWPPRLATTKVDTPLMQTAAADYARDDPEIVVVALGTNDAWLPQLTLAERVRRSARWWTGSPKRASSRSRSTSGPTAPNYDRGEARAINAELRQLADVTVPALTKAEISSDLIHPNASGIEAYARAVAHAARSCPPS